MRSIRQKLKIVLVVGLFLAGACFPLLPHRVALAAPTQKPGTCFYHGPNGSKTESCKSLGLTTDPNTGKPLNLSQDCYEVDATTSTETVTQVHCDGSSIGPPPQQMCTDAKTSAKGVPCTTCSDGVTLVAHKADCPSTDCSSGLKSCALISKYINPFINFLAALVGVVVVMSIIIGGIQYSSSAGDPQAASAAKNRIRNAIIALVTFLFLYALLNFLIPGGLV